MLAVIAAVAISRAQGSALGSWSPPIQWGAFPINMALLPNKSLMIFNRSRTDPTSGLETVAFKAWTVGPFPTYNTVTQIPYFDPHNHELFCCAQVAMPDGKLLMQGGHFHRDNVGLRDFTVYDPVTNTFDTRAFGAAGRWYPTMALLPNGRYFVCAGSADVVNGLTVPNYVPEMYATGSTALGNFDYVSALPTKEMQVYYPHLFVDPKDGNLLYVSSNRPGDGTQYRCQKLNLKTLQWTDFSAPEPNPGLGRDFSSAVMMDGIIIHAGGSKPGEVDTATYDATKTVAYCDLNAANPVWMQSASTDMVLARKNSTLTALPDGRLLSMNGNLRRQYVEDVSRTAPEIWTPFQPTLPWRLLAAPPATEQIGRGYHSNALLLPDGKVVVTGGEAEMSNIATKRTAQIFSPPYGGTNSWEATRPILSQAATEIRLGESFSVTATSPAGRPITKFRLISLGTTTHAYNMNQQFITLAFSGTGPTFSINAPSSSKIARPGYYMLFAVDDAGGTGIPSQAQIVRLRDLDPVYVSEDHVNIGIFANATRDYRELLINDNKYYGGSIQSAGFPQSVELEVLGNAPRVDTTKFRMTVESKPSLNCSIALFAWNWVLNKYQLISGSTGMLAGVEEVTEKVSTTLTNGRSAFIRTTDGRIRGLLRYTGANINLPFSVNIDTVDFGIR